MVMVRPILSGILLADFTRCFDLGGGFPSCRGTMSYRGCRPGASGFAAHLPLRMPDGSSRVYFMGGNGPHSGARNSSFGLATLPADRFAGVVAGPGGGGHPVVTRRDLNITGGQIIVTVDIVPGGSFSVGVEASPRFARSLPVTTSGTDVAVRFAAEPGGLSPDLIGQRRRLVIFAEDATVHTIGFM